jgi:hypothetical protein
VSARTTTTTTATAARLPRALHLVDLENVVGDPFVKGRAVADVYETVLTAGGHRTGDLVVVAANPWMLTELGFVAHTPCQLIAARGRDGADRALLGWARADWIVTRFDRLVVASGDGIFGSMVRAVRDAGVRVDVVHGGGRLSKLLRTAGVELVPVPVPVPAPCRRHPRAA